VDRDEEYTEYARARWATLVHSGMLLGASHAEAEDLAQTTLLRCYVAWSKVNRADNRDAYVSRVLLNSFRASRRRWWWSERPTEHVPDPGTPDSTDTVAGVDAVSRALGALSATQREVVVLRFYLHLSEQQMADVLNAPLGTVKSRLSRALARLSTDTNLAEFEGRRNP
jgi:RNA polymerase sigma-70 factor (sigma-E family)